MAMSKKAFARSMWEKYCHGKEDYEQMVRKNRESAVPGSRKTFLQQVKDRATAAGNMDDLKELDTWKDKDFGKQFGSNVPPDWKEKKDAAKTNDVEEAATAPATLTLAPAAAALPPHLRMVNGQITTAGGGMSHGSSDVLAAYFAHQNMLMRQEYVDYTTKTQANSHEMMMQKEANNHEMLMAIINNNNKDTKPQASGDSALMKEVVEGAFDGKMAEMTKTVEKAVEKSVKKVGPIVRKEVQPLKEEVDGMKEQIVMQDVRMGQRFDALTPLKSKLFHESPDQKSPGTPLLGLNAKQPINPPLYFEDMLAKEIEKGSTSLYQNLSQKHIAQMEEELPFSIELDDPSQLEPFIVASMTAENNKEGQDRHRVLGNLVAVITKPAVIVYFEQNDLFDEDDDYVGKIEDDELGVNGPDLYYFESQALLALGYVDSKVIEVEVEVVEDSFPVIKTFMITIASKRSYNEQESTVEAIVSASQKLPKIVKVEFHASNTDNENVEPFPISPPALQQLVQTPDITVAFRQTFLTENQEKALSTSKAKLRFILSDSFKMFETVLLHDKMSEVNVLPLDIVFEGDRARKPFKHPPFNWKHLEFAIKHGYVSKLGLINYQLRDIEELETLKRVKELYEEKIGDALTIDMISNENPLNWEMTNVRKFLNDDPEVIQAYLAKKNPPACPCPPIGNTGNTHSVTLPVPHGNAQPVDLPNTGVVPFEGSSLAVSLNNISFKRRVNGNTVTVKDGMVQVQKKGKGKTKNCFYCEKAGGWKLCDKHAEWYAEWYADYCRDKNEGGH